MIDPNANFYEARLKQIWANQRIKQLKTIWDTFLKSDFCTLTVEDKPDGSGQLIRMTSIEPLPAELVLTLGDAVHNMRCALDYTISELLGWKNTRLTFPMGEDREELITSFRTDGLDPCPSCGRGGKGKGRNAAIEMAVPGIGEFIVNEIAPYKAANGFLWPLGKLDARDKHRLLIPVLVPQTITGVNAVDANNNRSTGNTLRINDIGSAPMMGFGPGLKIESYGKATAEIFLNETGIIEGQPVFPTLLNMSQAVSKTIYRIDEFITRLGWKRTDA